MLTLLAASIGACSSSSDGGAPATSTVSPEAPAAESMPAATGGTPTVGEAPAQGASVAGGEGSAVTGGDIPLAGGGDVAVAGGGPAGGSPAAIAGDGGAPPAVVGGPDPKFLIFLLLGQSNMEGQPQPEAEDLVQDPRVKVLAYDNCANIGRTYNQWYTASPPLHSCPVGVGPGDYFAKTLIASLPEGYTIGLVPTAVNGAPIDVFRKGVPRPGWVLPPDNHWATGYEFIVSRAQEAQKVGVIRGILFHQGESNSQQPEWVDQVRTLVGDLRADLGIGEVPFLAGELYYEGCCAAHNPLVAQLVSSTPNAFLVSASGLGGSDQFHFDLPAQRELGRRYGTAMQQALTLP